MYGNGKKQMPSWNKIAKGYAEREFPPESFDGLPTTYLLPDKPTIMVCTPHSSRPIRDGSRFLGHEYWKELGLKLRAM
jgi:hypothetical protein